MNNDPIIKIKDISKSYTLTHSAKYDTIRDSVTNLFKKIFTIFTKKYKKDTKEEFWALKNINLSIKQGERVGIIGKNGAGKSTLLKILSQITHPTEGEIELTGQVASLLEVGTGFHPELTGRENIYLNGAMLGMKRSMIKKIFNQIVEFSGVEKFLDTPVKRYSSGMYVRLAFAVAAHLQSEIMMVDEVLAVGDTEFQKKCLDKMKSITSQGRTILFVSHNMAAIRTLCDRVILLKDGQIVADGNPNEVIKKYLGGASKKELIQEWTDENKAPHNSNVILKKVRITDKQANVLKDLYTDTEFNIEITFKNKNETYAGLTVVLFDSEYNVVLGSINNHEKNWYGKEMPKGIFKAICTIPANLLNDKSYIIGINIFGSGFSDYVEYNNILKIDILDGLTVRGDYYGVFQGPLRPQLKWETNKFIQ